ncbi:MAG TPA: histidinol dehydrogenase [Saprospiraceae bacterium]|nr:histidinol dehydrogenase [Saprospiraceae bacterium]
MTFQRIEEAGLQTLGPVITQMARAEGLEAHARAVDIRLSNQF